MTQLYETSDLKTHFQTDLWGNRVASMMNEIGSTSRRRKVSEKKVFQGVSYVVLFPESICGPHCWVCASVGTNGDTRYLLLVHKSFSLEKSAVVLFLREFSFCTRRSVRIGLIQKFYLPFRKKWSCVMKSIKYLVTCLNMSRGGRT